MLSIQAGNKKETFEKDYVVFDLETTGISQESDRIVEISAIKVKDGKAVEEFNRLVNPKCHIPAAASYVNNISDSMVCNEPPIEEVLPEFIDFIGDMVLVGHNIHYFDMGFIWRDCQNCLGLIPDNDYVDTLPLAKKCLPQMSHYKMTDLASHYGISTQGAHRALKDCHMTMEVYEHLKSEQESAGTKEIVLCKKCGLPMKLRNGRFGEFWGCSGYPDCKYTQNCNV